MSTVIVQGEVEMLVREWRLKNVMMFWGHDISETLLVDWLSGIRTAARIKTVYPFITL